MDKVKFQVGNASVSLIKGDITEMKTDAIVNAANSSLMGGGGVDGAIHRKGGPEILDECKKIRATRLPLGLPPGKAVITSAGNLSAKWIIHTVGPVWHGGNRGEPEILEEAYRSSLLKAVANGIESIAFPSISTGAYRYPIANASYVSIKTVKDFLKEKGFPNEVVFVLFSEKDLKIYLEVARKIFCPKPLPF